MIDREGLRRTMTDLGYDPEDIDRATDELCKSIKEVAAAMEALMGFLCEKLQPFKDELQQIAECAASVNAQPAKKPRPPKDLRPKHRGLTKAQRPPQRARSCCRKIRR